MKILDHSWFPFWFKQFGRDNVTVGIFKIKESFQATEDYGLVCSFPS